MRVDTQPRLRRKPQRLAPKTDEILAQIALHKGFLTPCAAALGISRSSLVRMFERSSKLAWACRQSREGLIDFTEQKMFQKIAEGDGKMIIFALSTIGRTRGYQLPKGTEVSFGDVSNTTISSVVVNAVPSGKFVTGPDEIQVDGRSLLGGRIVDDGKLN